MKNNIYRVSSSSPSSTPTDACATSSEQEDEPPPPPISARPERTKSIVSHFCKLLKIKNYLNINIKLENKIFYNSTQSQ